MGQTKSTIDLLFQRLSAAIAPLFSQTYLVVDYGSTAIKGILYRKSLLGEQVVRAELLEIVPGQEGQEGQEIVAAASRSLLREQAASQPVGGALRQGAAALPKKRGQQGSRAALGGREGTAATDQESYEYNLIRYIQSFFPGEHNFILNIPLEKALIRDITIPRIKGRPPAEVVPIEVEAQLHLPLEEVEVVGQPWSAGEEQLRVVSFAVSHTDLQNRAQPLLYSQSALQMLSVEAAGLADFTKLLGQHFCQGRTIAQIDIGGAKTIFNVVRDGQLAFARQICIGGDDITAIVSRILGMEIEAAERKKLELNIGIDSPRGAKVSDSNLKRSKVSRRDYLQIRQESRQVIEELGMEINRSLLALPCEPPESFYISGGVALMQGVSEALADHLKRPVELYPADLNTSQPLELWVTALGSGAHYLVSKAKRFDFLETPFGRMLRGGRVNLRAFLKPLLFGGLATIGMLTAFLFEIVHDQRQVAAYQGEIARVAQGIPGVSDAESAEALLAQAEELCRRGVAQANSVSFGVLEILRDIGQAIPPVDELDLKFRSFRFDQAGGAEIEVEVGDLSQASLVEQKLNESRLYSRVEVKNRKMLPPKQRVQLRLQLRLAENKSGDASSCL